MVKPGARNRSCSQSIHLMLGLNETPVVPLSLQIYIIVRVTQFIEILWVISIEMTILLHVVVTCYGNWSWVSALMCYWDLLIPRIG